MSIAGISSTNWDAYIQQSQTTAATSAAVIPGSTVSAPGLPPSVLGQPPGMQPASAQQTDPSQSSFKVHHHHHHGSAGGGKSGQSLDVSQTGTASADGTSSLDITV